MAISSFELLLEERSFPSFLSHRKNVKNGRGIQFLSTFGHIFPFTCKVSVKQSHANSVGWPFESSHLFLFVSLSSFKLVSTMVSLRHQSLVTPPPANPPGDEAHAWHLARPWPRWPLTGHSTSLFGQRPSLSQTSLASRLTAGSGRWRRLKWWHDDVRLHPGMFRLWRHERGIHPTREKLVWLLYDIDRLEPGTMTWPPEQTTFSLASLAPNVTLFT